RPTEERASLVTCSPGGVTVTCSPSGVTVSCSAGSDSVTCALVKSTIKIPTCAPMALELVERTCQRNLIFNTVRRGWGCQILLLRLSSCSTICHRAKFELYADFGRKTSRNTGAFRPD